MTALSFTIHGAEASPSMEQEFDAALNNRAAMPDKTTDSEQETGFNPMSGQPAFNDSLHVFRSPQFQGVVEDAIAFFAGTPVHPLPPTDRFIGPGVYGLYYAGDFEPYATIAEANLGAMVKPIYVGKAVPPGWRTGRISDSITADLHNRIGQHGASITLADNLNLDDFKCRFMIIRGIESDLIGPVEAELIRRQQPLWNVGIDGFGNHDPGAGRYDQARSHWDVLHPGRRWAERLRGASPSEEAVRARVNVFLIRQQGSEGDN